MMDFLDPKKRRAHNIRLLVGYVLVAIALALATTILIYQANGFGVKAGKVIQNGLVFVSSNPGPASIELNGEPYKDTTNTRMVLQSGTYTMRLSRAGYRDWQRALTVEGGSVEHFDYPLLIPQTLTTAKVADYSAGPPLVTQSPDRRWLLSQQPTANATVLDVYDLKDPKKITENKLTATVPASIFAVDQDGVQSLELVEWSNDNDHVLVRHVVGEQSEYLLLSRKDPATSINLTKQLQLTATQTITLQDKRADHFFVLDTANNNTLSSVTLDNAKVSQPSPLISDVIAFKSYGADTILYASNTGAPSDKTLIKMLVGGKTYTIRQVARSQSYLLELSRYDNHWYVVAGVSAENHVYVYKDPVEAMQSDPSSSLVPVDVIKITTPNFVGFSDNSEFIAVENGQDFSIYDAQNDRTHTYHVDKPLDAPQTHATWMDGFRLRMVSGGVVTIFDYDGTNMQSLQAASPSYLPFFDTSYQTAYSLNVAKPAASANPAQANAPQVELSTTSLRTVQDQ